MARGGKREGSGRPAGALNKATADIRALAQRYTDEAIKELARLATGAESETARVAAKLLDRGYGKSTQAVDVGIAQGPVTFTWMPRQ
jgi:hypothetical protein